MSDNPGVDKGRDVTEAILDDHQEMRRRFREILEGDMLPKFRAATSDGARARLGAGFVDPQSVIAGRVADDGRRVSTATSERLTPQ